MGMKIICATCGKESEKSTGDYNWSVRRGLKLYCNRTCAGIGRRTLHLKTPEQLKAEKAEYDREYRKKNAERLKIEKAEWFKKDYYANLEKYRKQRQQRMPYHVEYCRKPDQRTKERLRNRKKNGLTKVKACLCCGEEKELINFESYLIFPDNRLYMCKDCEENDLNELGITTREVLQCIRTGLYKTESVLTIRDYTPYPHLIEAHKYLLLLKRLTK